MDRIFSPWLYINILPIGAFFISIPFCVLIIALILLVLYIWHRRKKDTES